MPQQFKSTKMGKGEIKVVYSHKMMALHWMDRKTVTILSTFYDDVEMTRRRVKPDTSVPSVWWRYMFRTVLGCITPQKMFK
jgi:hypothetical protein